MSRTKRQVGMRIDIRTTEIWLEIRLNDKLGPIKAYADRLIETPAGKLRILDYATVQDLSGILGVAFPPDGPAEFLQQVDADGDLEIIINKKILFLYGAALKSAPQDGTPQDCSTLWDAQR
jgi:hypothetical protein